MGYFTQLWDDYAAYASVGGPARWAWTLMIGVTALLLVLIQLGKFARFCGQGIASGFRETYRKPGDEQVARQELLDRLGFDLRVVEDRLAQLDGDQQR